MTTFADALDDPATADLARRWAELQVIRGQQAHVSRSALVMPTAFRSPGQLAAALDPTTVETPALRIIDEALVRVQRHMDGRDDGLDRVILSMPPQEGKSERVTHYGAEWFLQRNPNLRVGLVSYGDDMVKRHSYAIRNDIVTNNGEEGNLDLGMRLRRDTKAAGRWNLNYPHRGGIYAVSIGGAFTGRPIDCLVIDDPVKDVRSAESVWQSQAAWDWWTAVARPRLAPGAPVIVVLTRWHELDLAGRMMRKQAEDEQSDLDHFDRWHVINIPAKADHDPNAGEVDILGRQPGDYMVSARGRTRAQWEATEAATPIPTWQALYQGRPNPKKGDVWQEPWWRRYESMLWTHDLVGAQYRVSVPHDLVLQSWDMAFKDTKTADFVVGQVWMKRGADTFLLDQVCKRLSFTETVRAMRHLSHKWPQSTAKLVEDKANGTAVIDSLRNEVPGLIPINPTDSKQGRAIAVSPFIRAGNVHLPGTDVALFDVDAFVSEANAFPNGAHDDQVDAASQALMHVYIDGHGISAISVPQGRIPTSTTSGRSTAGGPSAVPEHLRRSVPATGRLTG